MNEDQIKNIVYKYLTIYHDMLDSNIERIYIHIDNEFQYEGDMEALGFVEVNDDNEAHIWFNRDFCLNNPNEVNDLIVHEIAHLCTPINVKGEVDYSDHGVNWEKAISKLGGSTTKWTSLDTL